MHVSVHDSLKKLRTSYIDILYVHWWDYETSIPEIMGHLHNLVVSGKVLYLVRTAFSASSSYYLKCVFSGSFGRSCLGRRPG